jgi:membrane-bound serine protease (ClpP class)
VKAAELAVTESRSYTDQEALSQHLVDVIAASEAELLADLDGREVRRLDGTTLKLAVRDAAVVTIEPTFRERALTLVVNPNVAFLLLLIGALLVYVEVTHAGMVLPGVVGALCLLLAVTGFSFLPVNLTGVLLVIAAIGLFVAEFTVQGMGILGLAGVVSLALGGIMLVDVPGEGIRVDPGIAIGAAVGFGAIVLFLTTLAMRVLRRRVETGKEGMVGMLGDAVTDLSPRGKVLLRGEYWDAVASRPIARGARVRCTGLTGLLASVEPADEDGPGDPGPAARP